MGSAVGDGVGEGAGAGAGAGVGAGVGVTRRVLVGEVAALSFFVFLATARSTVVPALPARRRYVNWPFLSVFRLVIRVHLLPALRWISSADPFGDLVSLPLSVTCEPVAAVDAEIFNDNDRAEAADAGSIRTVDPSTESDRARTT